MAMMPASHATACQVWLAVGPPSIRDRTAVAVADTGWWRAKPCNQPGMVCTGMNAEEANTNGAMTGNVAACAVSGSPTLRPTTANTQAMANPKNTTKSTPATKAMTG